jgi:hypothetical protein
MASELSIRPPRTLHCNVMCAAESSNSVTLHSPMYTIIDDGLSPKFRPRMAKLCSENPAFGCVRKMWGAARKVKSDPGFSRSHIFSWRVTDGHMTTRKTSVDKA